MTLHEFQITIEGRERARRYERAVGAREVNAIGGFWGLKSGDARMLFQDLVGGSDDGRPDDALRAELAPLIEISRRRAREARGKRSG